MIDLRFVYLEKRLAPRGYQYRKSPYLVKWATTLDELEREIDHLDGHSIVIEGGFANHQIRNDGWPRGGCAPEFPDVRLSFESNTGPLSFPCYRFKSHEDNIRAIGLTLQRLRLIEELGTSPSGEQYRGWTALPEGEWSSADNALRWLHEIAGINSMGSLEAAYRQAARKAHPDVGGSNDLMAKVNRAKEYIEKARGAA